MEDDEDRLDILYNRFKADLKGSPDSLYYDEQELVDIFDYSGDIRDDHVRLEALLLGNRLFPDSTDLLKRRAIFLGDVGEEPFASFMQTVSAPMNDVMWDILRCKAAMPAGDEAVAALEAMVEVYEFKEDEETIQFVNLVKQLHQEEWLFSNLSEIRKKFSYQPTLLYEMARIAETDRQIELSIGLLEELTMLDPFNADYWGLLAELQSATEKYDDAISSLDYAKALLPDDHELLSLEGYIRLKQGRLREAVPALERALQLDSECYSARRNLAEAYKLIGADSSAAPLIRQLFEKDPSDATLLSDMLLYYPEETDDTLNRFHSASQECDEPATLQRIGELCLNDHADLGLRYIQWYSENCKLSQTGGFALLELLYVNGMYSEAYDFVMNNCRKLVLETNELPVVSIIASTLLRKRDFESAASFCRVWIERLETLPVTQNAYRLVNRGLLETLREMADMLKNNPQPTDDELKRIVL